MTKRVLSTTLLIILFVFCAISPQPAAARDARNLELRKALDAYLDGRWLPENEAKKATEEMAEEIKGAGCSIKDVERLLRMGRVNYGNGKAKGKVLKLQIKRKGVKKNKTIQLPLLDLQCEHVDYKTTFFLYVPKGYKPAKQTPLLVVGHGGNGAMSATYATKATISGILGWLPIVEKRRMILVAPQSERGWGTIGYSIIFSLIIPREALGCFASK